MARTSGRSLGRKLARKLAARPRGGTGVPDGTMVPERPW